MRRLLIAAGLAFGLFSSSDVHGQSFSTFDLDRYYNSTRGSYVPYDGMPYTQRYNYDPAGIFYPGYDAQRLLLMDYYDRVIRADQFGYCPPRDPFCDPAAVPSGWRFGSGWRFSKRW